MIVLVCSQKGGVGKSTTATNLAALLACNGYDICLVDADKQSTSANWVADRQENEHLPAIHIVQKYDNIKKTLEDLDRRYEYVIVDAAGRDSREMRTGMLAAHKVLIPLQCSQPDLDTLETMKDIVTQAKDVNEDMQIYTFLNRAPTNPSINEDEEAKELLSDYEELNPVKTIVRDRKAYRDAMKVGKGIGELNNQKAIEEIKSLYLEVFTNEFQEKKS